MYDIIKFWHPIILILFLLLMTRVGSAQDLDPRAYARVPINITFVVAGFGYSYGSVITDPSITIKDLDADVETPMIGAGHTFNLFGLTSQVFGALPYTWAQLTGSVLGEEKSSSRSGLSDMRLRLSVLLIGASAATLAQLAKDKLQIVIGTSLSITAPTGQFFPDKLINIGTNRWSFKPEVGLSYPINKHWFFDLYAGVWLFTDNDSFFPGNSVRSQDPLLTVQTHISYNVNPLMWAALDFTYYNGGQSSVNGIYNDDVQNNVRLGGTLNMPLSKQNSIKIAYSTGAIIRFSSNFSTISISWQTAFF